MSHVLRCLDDGMRFPDEAESALALHLRGWMHHADLLTKDFLLRSNFLCGKSFFALQIRHASAKH